MLTNSTPNDYINTLEGLKLEIQKARLNSIKSINKELIKLYSYVGKIVTDKTESGWGENVVEKLSKDIQLSYPGIKGFSISNIWRMKSFYLQYKDNVKLVTVSRELSWSVNVIIIEQCKSNDEREFYLNNAQNWSVRKVKEKIKINEYLNVKNNQTNYINTIPNPDSEIAIRAVSDNYNLNFITLENDHLERELENEIVKNIVSFLGEMDGYFSFVGRQVKMKLDEDEYFIDLLFYHRILKRLVIVELKTVPFIPEFAGKMQFYLNLADETLRVEGEGETIGLIICREKNRTKVEYTLKDLSRPIGVATYNHNELDKSLSKYLPSEEDIEKTLSEF
jgi:predicted nuclease of restriction endonuclease-like (RecB) superfamily